MSQWISERIDTRLRFRPEMARAVREGAGLTQDDIADALGVHRVSVARWELGLRRPRREFLAAYQHLLDEIQARVDWDASDRTVGP